MAQVNETNNTSYDSRSESLPFVLAFDPSARDRAHESLEQLCAALAHEALMGIGLETVEQLQSLLWLTANIGTEPGPSERLVYLREALVLLCSGAAMHLRPAGEMLSPERERGEQLWHRDVPPLIRGVLAQIERDTAAEKAGAR
jgi:hypothetical protein